MRYPSPVLTIISGEKMTSKLTAQQKAVIEVLNTARSMELYAIVQYMHQHYTLDDADYKKLASEVKHIAISEMKHAEAFAERIKDISGDEQPTANIANDITKGQPVEKIFAFNADTETDTIAKYNEFAALCRENGDVISAQLFERIAEVEQEHFNYYDDTNTHIKTLGGSFLARVIEKG
jgi:bacterioferritin